MFAKVTCGDIPIPCAEPVDYTRDEKVDMHNVVRTWPTANVNRNRRTMAKAEMEPMPTIYRISFFS